MILSRKRVGQLVSKKSSNNAKPLDELELFNWHRYLLASRLTMDSDVLDIACGEGYGSSVLSETSKSVIGMDISKKLIRDASLKYKRANLKFRAGNICQIPMRPACVDYVVSFETLEHEKCHEKIVRELKRVLKPRGTLLLSTPEKKSFQRNGYFFPDHVREIGLEQFRRLLKKHFKNVQIFGQNTCFASVILPEDSMKVGRRFFFRDGKNKVSSYEWIENAPFLFALASDFTLPDLAFGLFEGGSDSRTTLAKLRWFLESRGE